MILAATPSPGAFPGFIMAAKGLGFILGTSAASEVAWGGGGDPDAAGLVVSVREGGGAMAAPPVVAVEMQTQLVIVVGMRRGLKVGNSGKSRQILRNHFGAKMSRLVVPTQS